MTSFFWKQMKFLPKVRQRELIIGQLLQNFPILRATNEETVNEDVLVNVHELLLSPHSFEILLGADEDPSRESRDKVVSDSIEEDNSVKEVPTRRRGKEPFWSKFPALVQTATNFIKLQLLFARKVSGLKEKWISLDIIHHLMVTPRKIQEGRSDRKGYSTQNSQEIQPAQRRKWQQALTIQQGQL